MSSMYGQVPVRALDVWVDVGVKNFQWICASRGIGTVVIKGAHQYDRQSLQITFTLDHVIISACLECRNGGVFVSHAGDDNHGERQRIFTNVVEQRHSITIVQVYIREHQIDWVRVDALQTGKRIADIGDSFNREMRRGSD